jgi:anti-sigma factor RsiW
MMFVRSFVCRDAVALISDYLDGLLSPRNLRRLERHLAGCPACSAYLEQMRVTKTLLGSVQASDLTEEALARLTDLYFDFLADDES